MRFGGLVLAALSISVWSAPASAQTGTISGELSYPSDYIPSDMRVCAIAINTKAEICTGKHVKKGRKTVHSLSVPVGDYKVYASTRELPNYKAHWSEYVACGNNAKCKSHQPIVVRVFADSRLTGIHPQDWYAP